MTRETRSERTLRLLTLRLEELARALERSGARAESVRRLLELASLATLHAVSLELITSERAAEVWSAAERRHPVLATLELRHPHAPERAAA